jgi:prenyltransferase beta subunit
LVPTIQEEGTPKNTTISSGGNYQSVDFILDNKIDNYNAYGFFPQRYEPSLQATYYGLNILNSIGKLNSLNVSDVENIIMKHYDPYTNLFMDKYAYRYLDTDFSQVYYPLSTTLEINCYAILSLDILGRLDLINKNDLISYIWSCYNNDSSGFIGQPYNSALDPYFKFSTLDNTFFAIRALNLLMQDWLNYTTEREALVTYIKSLQLNSITGWKLGGFSNDNATSLNSLYPLFEPNLLSTYYAIKSLQMFGEESSINTANFFQFLNSLYNPTKFYFRISLNDYNINFTNIVATVIGLELSDITGFPSIDRNNILSFIYNSRNSIGIWDGSNTIRYHEIIDSFQIVRSLTNTGEIDILTSIDKEQIANTIIEYYYAYEGFSLLSIDYTTLNLLNSIISSFDLNNRLLELDIPQLYLTLKNSYFYDAVSTHGFFDYINIDDDYKGFRSFPIEFYSSGSHNNIDEIGYLLSHKATFYALDSFKRIYKLDDFALTNDLSQLLGDIISTQFLNPSYSDKNGAFLSSRAYNPAFAPYQSKNIFFEYSYYAIRCMEFIANQLGLGNLTNLGFSVIELLNYISYHSIETATYLYFQPHYTNSIEIILENTYYMIYVLKALSMYNLDEVKIKNYVLANINYSSIKNIYYSYKLSKILDVEITLDYDLIYDLVGDIFNSSFMEYYLTTDNQEISQEIIYWISDMVVNDLGNSITTLNIEYLPNCEFLSIGNNIIFNISSRYSGTYWLYVDGELLDSDSFTSNGDVITKSIDNYTDKMGDHLVKINATAVDGHYSETTSVFTVYSDSSTIVNIISLENYEFMTTGHNISFSIHSDYPDMYNFSINGNLLSSGSYYDGELFVFQIDGYEVGLHFIEIWARGLDGIEGNAYGNFTVYSTSETIISIHSLNNYIFNSTGNFLNFSIYSDYPEFYQVKIDGNIIDNGTYVSGISILCSIDGYTVGTHSIQAWANSTDKKETTTSVQFSVFSNSFLEIEFLDLQNYEFKSIGNTFIFLVNASFPDTIKFFIDNNLIWFGSYQHSGETFNFSIDNYFVGEHNITVWCNSTDGKEAISESSFTVFSLSNTIVNIEELSDYEFLTTGHYVKFNISSFYPDYYIIYIDTIAVVNDTYTSGTYNLYSIDGYQVGMHTLTVWAIGEDHKIGIATGEFYIYSNSTTKIIVNEIPSYEFMTVGNYLNFSIESTYIGSFNVTIDGILSDYGVYNVGVNILSSIDGYNVGTHSISINAKSIDGKLTNYSTNFLVYTISNTLVIIHHLEGFGFMTTGNYLNFSIISQYPDYFRLWINDELVYTNNYSDGEFIIFSLDNYTDSVGNHSISIWAIGKDYQVGYIEAQFSVYSVSITLIEVSRLQDFEFMTKGHSIIFTIFSKYPDYYKLFIDGTLVSSGLYSENNSIIFPLDNYSEIVGIHKIFIWATSKDGKNATYTGNFDVYSTSSITIHIIQLDDYLYDSIGNELKFYISTKYPDYFILSIDGVPVHSSSFNNNNSIILSIDNLEVGQHIISIWVITLDKLEEEVLVYFEVYAMDEFIAGYDLDLFRVILSITISFITIPGIVIVVSNQFKKKIKTQTK